MPPTKTLLCAAVATSLTVVGLTAALAPQALAGTVCDSMTTPVFHRFNPTTKVSILTTSATEAATAARGGYTVDHGTPFKAAKVAASGLYGAELLTKASPVDRVYMPNPKEAASAVAKYGYTAKGMAFFVPTDAKACTIPINRYRKQAQHTYATTAKQNSDLVAAGWTKEGATFYGAPSTTTPSIPPPTTSPAPSTPSAPVDTKFSIAVYPDTQQEVGTDSRYIDRAKYLLERKAEFDLKFVTTSGDNVNWDTPDHAQYEVISKGLRPFETAKMPYSLTNGNHDNMATGIGGGARDSTNTRTLFRDTKTINGYFPAARLGAVRGAFEAGKIDNSWSSFTAGGQKWMVLNLEMWPRLAAVDWARGVVGSNPDYNVIIATHSYINGDGSITQCTYTRCSYGDASPQYLYDKLVSQYPNVKMTLSGHTGSTGMRVDKGVRGNKIVNYLTTIHSNTTNPIRMIEIDTAAQTAKTWVYGPHMNKSFPEASNTQTAMGWVKS